MAKPQNQAQAGERGTVNPHRDNTIQTYKCAFEKQYFLIKI